MDAWTGYRRFALGLEAEDEPLSRHDVEGLDAGLRQWQRTGAWEDADDV